MLDSESQIDSSIVKWSTDGNSFIIMDQNQFEEVCITFSRHAMYHVTHFELLCFVNSTPFQRILIIQSSLVAL